MTASLAKKNKKLYVIDLKDAIYIYVSQRCTYVVSVEGRFRLKRNIKEWEDALKDRGWFRAHRAFLINLDQIESIVELFRFGASAGMA